MNKCTNCGEWSFNGCEARIFEARPCINDFTCCGQCDLIDECSWICGFIEDGTYSRDK